jgi:hypothetical protein
MTVGDLAPLRIKDFFHQPKLAKNGPMTKVVVKKP